MADWRLAGEFLAARAANLVSVPGWVGDFSDEEVLFLTDIFPTGYQGAENADVKDGDIIELDIPNRSIRLAVDDAELSRRRTEMEALGAKAWKPAKRDRKVSTALKAYAALTTSAARGAVRVVED